MLKAVTRQAAKVDAKIKQLNDEAATSESGRKQRQQRITTAYFFDHYATPEDIAVMVTEEDFLDAHRELIPSVSAGELAHYERVRATFEGGRGQGGDASSQQQQQQRTSSQNISTAKGKGKAVAPPIPSKGKGKAVATSDDDEGDGVEADGEDGVSTRYKSRDKGKGKAVAVDDGEFQQGKASDDEGLYN